MKPGPKPSSLTLAIGGLGGIGLEIARYVDAGRIPNMKLAAVSVRDRDKAKSHFANFTAPPEIFSLSELADKADIVVECVPATSFNDIAEPAIERGRIFMPLSVGALLSRMHLVERAAETGARIIVPTGALLGLDAVRAAAVGEINSVTMVTRKPPAGLANAPYLLENGITVEGLIAGKRVFEGSARDAAKGFPANVNVAAALALAGIGPDATRIEIWADPGVDRNTHTIRVDSDSSAFTMTIENIPTEVNPRTGKITAQSAIAALARLTAPLVVGS